MESRGYIKIANDNAPKREILTRHAQYSGKHTAIKNPILRPETDSFQNIPDLIKSGQTSGRYDSAKSLCLLYTSDAADE